MHKMVCTKIHISKSTIRQHDKLYYTPALPKQNRVIAFHNNKITINRKQEIKASDVRHWAAKVLKPNTIKRTLAQILSTENASYLDDLHAFYL